MPLNQPWKRERERKEEEDPLERSIIERGARGEWIAVAGNELKFKTAREISRVSFETSK